MCFYSNTNRARHLQYEENIVYLTHVHHHFCRVRKAEPRHQLGNVLLLNNWALESTTSTWDTTQINTWPHHHIVVRCQSILRPLQSICQKSSRFTDIEGKHNRYPCSTDTYALVNYAIRISQASPWDTVILTEALQFVSLLSCLWRNEVFRRGRETRSNAAIYILLKIIFARCYGTENNASLMQWNW